MNKRTFTLLVASLFIIKAAAQQVQEVQRSVITKRTATWCTNCGTWGWTLMEGLIEDNEEKAVIIAAHDSGLLQTSVASEITDNWGAFSQPRFFLNEADQNATPAQIQNVRTQMKQAVDQAFSQMPVANTGFNLSFANNILKVDAKVKFFQNADGEYFLGMYLLEDNVQEIQAGHTGDANHKKVLRYSFTGFSWGNEIINGSVSAGEEFELDFELPLGSIDGYDYEVAGIIWKKENGVYKPVNAWSQTVDNLTSSVPDVTSLTGFAVMPTAATSQATVQLELSGYLPATMLTLLDQQGKMITVIHEGPLGQGLHTFTLDKDMFGVSGLAFLQFTDGKGVRTEKVIFL